MADELRNLLWKNSDTQSKRVYHSLATAGFETIEQVLRFIASDWKTFPFRRPLFFGPKSKVVLIRKLKESGYIAQDD